MAFNYLNGTGLSVIPIWKKGIYICEFMSVLQIRGSIGLIRENN